MADIALEAVSQANNLLLAEILAKLATASDNPEAFIEGIRSDLMDSVDAAAFRDAGDPDGDRIKHAILAMLENVLRGARGLAGVPVQGPRGQI